MATSTYPTMTGATGVTEAANFIPQLWSDEIIATYKSNLKMAPLVKTMKMQGKKGDTINIPNPARASANAKAENTAVTIISDVAGTTAVNINRHFEYSKLIEDIADVQALSSMRKFYTDDAGYALAKQIDTDLMMAATAFNGGTLNLTNAGTGTQFEGANSYFIDASTGLTAYADDTVVAADVFTDAGFRALIKLMDDNDVPMDNRRFVVPPTLRSAIMGIDRYVSSDFRDPRTVQTGYIGQVYGIDVYVSSNCVVAETAANNATGTADLRAALLFHRDALILAEQVSVRSQTQYVYADDSLDNVEEYALAA